MRNLRRWLADHEVDLAYVSMLKHDAYVAVGEGRGGGSRSCSGPRGRGRRATSPGKRWGRFGRRIGARCKQADAVVSISQAVTDELARGGLRPVEDPRDPQRRARPRRPWQRRPDWRERPARRVRRPARAEKGLDVLIHAWPAVRAAFPGARLTLVGEGPERPALEGIVAGARPGRRRRAAGRVGRPVRRLRGADLFVLPSREEGMSVALLEAMALGVPLVATVDPGQPPARSRTASTAGSSPPTTPPRSPARCSTSGPTSTAPSTWAAPPAAGSRTSSRSPPSRGRHLELFRTMLMRDDR